MADDHSVHATFRLPNLDLILTEMREISTRQRSLEESQRVLNQKQIEDRELLVSIHSLLENISGNVRNTVEKDSNTPLPSRDTSSSTVVNSSMLPGSPTIGPARKRKRVLKPTIPQGFSAGNQTAPTVRFAPSEQDRSATLAMDVDESPSAHSPKVASLSSAGDGGKLAGFSFRNSDAQIAARKASRESGLFVRQGSEVPTDSEDEIQPRGPDVPRSNSKHHSNNEDPPTTTSSSMESPMDPPNRHSWSTQNPVVRGPRSRLPDIAPNDNAPNETRSALTRTSRHTIGLPVTSQSSPQGMIGLPVSSQISPSRKGETRGPTKRQTRKPSPPPGMINWPDVDPSLLNQRQKTARK